MSENDFLNSTPGEIYDLIACHAVYTGEAVEVKKKKKKLSFDEALQILRV